MTAPKTAPTGASVPDFLASIGDERQRADALALDELCRAATGADGAMWGAAIVGYGSSTITYADGRTAPWFAIGFAPRSGTFAIYGTGSAEGREELLARLGAHRTGTACLYVKRLADVDVEVLGELLRASA